MATEYIMTQSGPVRLTGQAGATEISWGDVTGKPSAFAPEPHTHPTDTTRAPVNSPSFTGTPTAPTPATGTNNTELATTAFVKAQGYLTTAPVTSVAGKTGAVSITAGDVGLGNANNTSDADKPVSTAQQTALNGKVSKDGDTMTGALVAQSNTDYAVAQARNIVISTTDLTAGVSALANGTVYLVYE